MTSDWTAFDQLLASRRRAIVEGFVDFLRLNSVSQEPDKVRATGEWLAEAVRARGLEGRLLETGGNPAVFGERRVLGATRTVLIYCHYDILKLPTLLAPYANANNRQRSPNEHLRLDHLFQGVRTTARLLTDLDPAATAS